MNSLKERIESTIITKTFNISGMPETVYNEVNAFCRENYGDSRWVMVADLFRFAKKDYRFELLYDEINKLKAKVAELEAAPKTESKRVVKTFGGNNE